MDVGGKGDAIVDGERNVALTCSYGRWWENLYAYVLFWW